jgi:ornithine decarboxylase
MNRTKAKQFIEQLTMSSMISDLPVMGTLGIEDDLLADLQIPIHDIRSLGSVHAYAASRVERGLETESFLVVNIAYVLRQWTAWQRELPMVHPFFAVKTNPDPVILRLLAHLGFGFDCASLGELNTILHTLGDKLSFGKSGKGRQSIVYAHPAKARHMMQYAIDHDVHHTVFDGEDELRKIAEMPNHEKLRLLVRISVNDKNSRFAFSKKFGVPVDHALELLQVAKSLNLNLVGVSFHVGSGCRDPLGYAAGLKGAQVVFDEWVELGMPPMTMVDIGGGFSGDYVDLGPDAPRFEDLTKVIREGIADFKANYKYGVDNLRFIAEPGRYFVSDSTTLATKVVARKGGREKFQYLYVDDGVYGNLNNIIYDFSKRVPSKMKLVKNIHLMDDDETPKQSVKSLHLFVFCLLQS